MNLHFKAKILNGRYKEHFLSQPLLYYTKRVYVVFFLIIITIYIALFN